MYICGDFWALGVSPYRWASPNLAAVDTTSGRVDRTFVATTDGAVNDCAVSGSLGQLFIGGHFDLAGGQNAYQDTGEVRRHVAAVNATTGALDPWNPTANSVPGLYALVVSATDVSAGGDFTKINWREQQGYAQFSLDP